jgi:hypothetical protein
MTIAARARVLAGAVADPFHVSHHRDGRSFLGFTKRRQEATSELHSGSASRPVLEHYSIPFLDQMVAMVTAATVMSYAIYAVNSPLIGAKMLGTLPPVVYGIFRYLYLVYDRKIPGDMILPGLRMIGAPSGSPRLLLAITTGRNGPGVWARCSTAGSSDPTPHGGWQERARTPAFPHMLRRGMRVSAWRGAEGLSPRRERDPISSDLRWLDLGIPCPRPGAARLWGGGQGVRCGRQARSASAKTQTQQDRGAGGSGRGRPRSPGKSPSFSAKRYCCSTVCRPFCGSALEDLRRLTSRPAAGSLKRAKFLETADASRLGGHRSRSPRAPWSVSAWWLGLPRFSMPTSRRH